MQAGLLSPDPAADLQPVTESLRRTLGVDLIVIFDMQGIRYTHYDPRYINTPYGASDRDPALSGKAYYTRCSCVGVQSVRGLAPIRAADGQQIGVAVVGTFVDNVVAGLHQLRLALGASLGVLLVLAAAAAFWISGNIRASLSGLEPWKIAALLREREALLQSIREGLVAIDREGRITLMNEAARTLIGVEADPVGRPAAELVPELRLTELLAGATRSDEELVLAHRVVLCTGVPISVAGQVGGALVSFRGKTEVTRLAEELTGVRRFIDGLRAQNHEYLNKLQTLAGLIHLGAYQEAAEFISRTTRVRQAAVQHVLANVGDAATAGLLMGKLSEAQEKGVEMVIVPESRLRGLPPHFDSSVMVSVLGNLLENAVEALAAQPSGRRRVEVALKEERKILLIEVADSGPGIPASLRPHIFERGVSSKGPGRGLGLSLVQERVRQAGGEVRVECPEEGGTRFTVRIPWRPPAAKAVGA